VRGDVVLAQHLDGPLRRTVATLDDDDPASLGQVPADVMDRGLDVAAIGLDPRGADRAGLDGAGLDVDVGPHHLTEGVAQDLGLGVGRSAEADLATSSGWNAAVLSYNHDPAYVLAVNAAAVAYAARA
jgi:hypothetical protein